MLGFTTSPVALMDSIGGKKGIKDRLPPKSSVGLARTDTGILDAERIRFDDIPGPYIEKADGIALVSIGKIHEALEGCACPIGALGREFLEKLEVNSKEMVLIDMEAGVEHFGRGVEAGVDSILIVVDPSFESLELAGRIKEICQGMGISNVNAVLNRISSGDIADKLTSALSGKGLDVLGIIGQDEEVFMAGLEGRMPSGDTAAGAVNAVLNRLLDKENI